MKPLIPGYNAQYLVRNLDVSKAIGIESGLNSVLERLEAQKRPIKWLISRLHIEKKKAEDLVEILLKYRDEVPVYYQDNSR